MIPPATGQCCWFVTALLALHVVSHETPPASVMATVYVVANIHWPVVTMAHCALPRAVGPLFMMAPPAGATSSVPVLVGKPTKVLVADLALPAVFILLATAVTVVTAVAGSDNHHRRTHKGWNGEDSFLSVDLVVGNAPATGDEHRDRE